MDHLFAATFSSIFQALLKIFLIAAVAGWLSYRKIIKENLIDGLSMLVVYVFLPFMTFSTILTTFNPGSQTYWWWIPLAGVGIPLAGLIFSALLFARHIPEKKSLFPLASMHNAAYLILPIGEFAFKDQFQEFSLVCFLLLLGLNPFMWSVGKILLTNSPKNGSIFKQIITPPFIANVLAIVLVLTGLSRFVPGFIVESAGFLGDATVPVATFILGATLALSIKSIPPFMDTFRVLFVKYALLPATVIAFLYFSGLGERYPLPAQVLVLQATSAPATAHILMIRTYGGDVRKAGGIIFAGYCLCMLAIPLWLTIWNTVIAR
jgi:predicted permease